MKAVQRCAGGRQSIDHGALVARASGCPLPVSLPYRHLVALETTAFVMLDVGSNKGYAAASAFDALCPQLHFNPRRLADVLEQERLLRKHAICGVCDQCRERHDAGGTGGTATSGGNSSECPLHVYGFDGNRAMVALQHRARSRFASAVATAWTPQWLAVADEVSTRDFSQGLGMHNEVGGLVENGTLAYDEL
eukprot:7379173-Prymnesium_polylepis.1